MANFYPDPEDFQRSFTVEKRMDMLPCHPAAIPVSVPDGYVLVHNNIPHAANTPCGLNGFLAWFQKRRGNKLVPSDKLVRCECGWSGLAHYQLDTIAVRRGIA